MKFSVKERLGRSAIRLNVPGQDYPATMHSKGPF